MGNRGSEWNKWDFHVHTPYSVLRNGYGDPNNEETWKKYSKLLKEECDKQNIVGLGITDYYSIEGYEKLYNNRSKYGLEDIFIFPNIEFRTNDVIYTDSNSRQNVKKVNFHILFSPEVPIDEIKENFLENLIFYNVSTVFGDTYSKKLKKNNIIKFGKKLRENGVTRNKSDLVIGYNNLLINMDDILEELNNNSEFTGKYLCVMADENLSNIDWDSQAASLRVKLTKQPTNEIDAIGSPPFK
ncbi:hypothetical protein J3E07_001618 [Methanococcus voltae]|uniref:PHP domain protein n=1 Tax=Methanococcus voltae TaxID=2188 RepID=A0A8J7RHX6_METVO|nr:hypothetical protein [Methanococcus voltae]MBP2202177.1 hypothetical protein [Methanococcus voltae]